MNRDEHLKWAKERALAELERSGAGITGAMASIQSDLRKHPDLRGHSGLELMFPLVLGGHMDTEQDVREFIEGLS